MKMKSIWHDSIAAVAAFAAVAVFAAITARYSPLLAVIELSVAFVLFAFFLIRTRVNARRFASFAKRLYRKMDFTDARVLNSFPVPVVLCDSDGTVLWVSEKFLNRVVHSKQILADSIQSYIEGREFSEIINSHETAVHINDRDYSVFTNSYTAEGQERYVLYFVDNTQLKNIEREFNLSRPVVAFLEVDNIDASGYDLRESERAEFRSMVEAVIENWAGEFPCILKRLSDARFMIVAQRRDADTMIETKFPVLDSVRNLKYKNLDISATISIGMSDGETFLQCERRAKKALEMALDRGGDQAAVVNKDDSYDFFGGVSKSVEKRGKVQARVIGSALAEFIEASDEVIVMGHKWPDLDVMGAAVGICCAAEALGVASYIVTDTSKTLSLSLLERINADAFLKEAIIDEQTALKLISKKTLLVVVDTHIKTFVEFPEVYKKASTVFVIDHHRKSTDAIDNAVVFHLDPNASSASEMVTELLEYIDPEPNITKLTAEALLSGIMLDTKNFVLGCGVRTFEAAAFLREKSADTVSVRKLFSTSMQVNKLRNDVVSSADKYNRSAIACARFESEDIRIICSQAADELLNVSEVDASFVLYMSGDTVCISARSLGAANVQVIMEALGGGGHRTMAAAQLKEVSLETAVEKLKATVDEFLN